MAFKFNFFDEAGPFQAAQTRSGDDLTPIFGRDATLKSNASLLPSGRVNDEAIGRSLARLANSSQGERPDIHVLPDGTTVTTLNGGTLSQQDRIAQATDVLPGRYEGGLKIWECSFDAISVLKDVPRVGRVLDLGCGAGLVGIWILKTWPECEVTFHDLNFDVLERATIPNVNLNDKAFMKRSHFCFGPWDSSPELLDDSFDLIVTADTLYDPETLEALSKVILRVLAPGGKAYIAAKRFYFGVGGGVSTFTSLMARLGGCQTRVLASFQDGVSNIRDVLELTKL